MALLEKQLNKYIEANFSEKEKALAETERSVQRHFAKSREYRIMLQNYQKELRERDSALSEKDAELSKRKEDLDEFESTLKARVKEDVMRDAKEEKAALKADSIRLQEEIKSLSAKKAALWQRNTKLLIGSPEWSKKKAKYLMKYLPMQINFKNSSCLLMGMNLKAMLLICSQKTAMKKLR